MPELNVTQETLDSLILAVRVARNHFKQHQNDSNGSVKGLYSNRVSQMADTLTILEEFDKAQMKAGGVCCPACEAGEHDTSFSRLNHMTMKCDCPCNAESLEAVRKREIERLRTEGALPRITPLGRPHPIE